MRTMIATKLDNLFERWQQARTFNSFIRDGVIQEAEYQKARVKICWILKDCNTSSGQPWTKPLEYFSNRRDWPSDTDDWPPDLRPESWNFWPNVLRRSYGVECAPCSYQQADSGFRQSGIWKRIAGVN